MYISNYLNAMLTPLVVYRGAISRAAIDDGENTRALAAAKRRVGTSVVSSTRGGFAIIVVARSWSKKP